MVRATAPTPARPTEDVLLDAARDAVIEHGIRRTSASDIARRSGLSRQTLYRYWPDVRSLLAALVTRELLAQLPAAGAAGDTGAVTLDGFVTELVDTARTVRDLPIIARLRETDPELFARYILERLGSSQRAILDLLETRIHAAQAAGAVRAGDPPVIAAMILLIAQSAIQSAPLVAPWLPDDAWERELRIALAGYLRPEVVA